MAEQLLEKQIATITGQKTAMPDHIVETNEMVEAPSRHSCQCTGAQNLAALAAKLLKVMETCASIPKDKQNAAQKYRYVSSDAILGRVNRALVDAKLATVCSLDVIDRQPRTTNTGGMWELVTVRARLTIIDSETGASIESEGIGQGYDGGDKALSKAQTQARKYAWLLALNISTGDDPEADSMTDRVQEPAVRCKHCGEPVLHVDDDEFEGMKVKVYACAKCKKETRIKEKA